jgi:hypothetical protein
MSKAILDNCQTFLFGFFFIGLIPYLSGQSTAGIQGKIIDQEGLPIPQAYVFVDQTTYKTASDSNGFYQLTLPADTLLKIWFSHIGFEKQVITVRLRDGVMEKRNMRMQIREMNTVEVEGSQSAKDNLERIDIQSVGIQPSISGGVEGILKTTGMGVSSRNELSSNYSVRGGNFDENLVYVNGIEIYRPQLIRTGQEEGLSFINPNMVENVYFSAGGFSSRYGDKMASVLDITYRKPKRFGGSVMLSLLGAEATAFGASKDQKLSGIVGFRYRTNQSVLGTLDTQGEYQPDFLDLQGYFTYRPSRKWEFGYLGYVANNSYNFFPQNRTTELGNLSQALRLDVSLTGKEESFFRTFFNAVSTTYFVSDALKIDLTASSSISKERQYKDVDGVYILGELDRNFGSETFGEVIENRGIGAFIEHARNDLESTLITLKHTGSFSYANKLLNWGLTFRSEDIRDRLDEWVYQDSAGFSVPRRPLDQIVLNNIIRADNTVQSNRYMGYLQNQWFLVLEEERSLTINAGLRAQYWDFNRQFMLSPRANAAYTVPFSRNIDDSTRVNKKMVYRFAAGVYYQPPFYHEMRRLDGTVNFDIRAQESLHFIAGIDYHFFIWKRPFKLTTELYYKPMENLVPFQVDNIRLLYFGTNNARGYAYGLDAKLNGEFVKGIESYISVSFLKTEEDLLDDFYNEFYNESGEVVSPGDPTAVDSATFYPGFIPRPFDNRVVVNLFFQDEMPMWPTFKVHLNLALVTGFPFGPPNGQRYQDVLRSTPYRRVDIGFSKTFVDPKTGKTKGLFKPFKDAWISFEIFNLIDIANIISYNWVEDVTGTNYAVPNFLTGRRINLKLYLAF